MAVGMTGKLAAGMTGALAVGMLHMGFRGRGRLAAAGPLLGRDVARGRLKTPTARSVYSNDWKAARQGAAYLSQGRTFSAK